MNATPVAALATYMAARNGDRDMQDLFNPYGAILYDRDAKETVDKETARSFLELSRRNLVPGWVVELADFKLLRTAAK